MTTVDVLTKARDLIARPGGWCQGTWEKDGAVCMIKAVTASARDLPAEKRAHVVADGCNLIRQAICGPIIPFNEAPERTHSQVIAAFDRAIAAATPPTEEVPS